MLLRWKLSRAARLIRLRSTLRSKALLAALVKTLHVPDPHTPLYLSNGHPNPEYDAYICTLASVVMTCPNLEALTGFYPFYNHQFDRLTHALSTRTKLREHVWIIAENDDVSTRSRSQLPPGLLDEQQTFQFLLYHQRWKQLESLMLCSPGSLGVIEHELFINILHSLPALRNLCISSFDTDDFHDLTLLSLPPWITTLRLEESLGVTDAGLTRWAASPNSTQIQRLSFLHQNIRSLLTLSKIFASLQRLVKFTIVQTDVVLSLPNDAGQVLVQPVLASKSLQFLHWDVSDHEAMEEHIQPTLNMQLAFSISHLGFPHLTHLRAPRDTLPLGILQSVCKVTNDVNTKPDDNILHSYPLRELRRSNSLRAARLRAQKINGHAANDSGRVPNEVNVEVVPSMDRLTVPRPTQKAISDHSISTITSLGTNNSNISNKSMNSTSTNANYVYEVVSPISLGQDLSSSLAPDDGLVSPISSEQGQIYLFGRNSDKTQVFSTTGQANCCQRQLGTR